MEREDVISRLCALVSLVAKEVDDPMLSHDCFCGENALSALNPRVAKQFVEIIEQATMNFLVARRNKSVSNG